MTPLAATAAMIASGAALGVAPMRGVSCDWLACVAAVDPSDNSPRIIAATLAVYYPRSFLKFILLGFLLVSLPLVYALAELILSLDRLQSQGQEAVQQAAQAGRASRQLFEQAATLERIVRQHLILEDPALLDDYARVRRNSGRRPRQLAQLPLDARPAGRARGARRQREPRCTSCSSRRSARRTRRRSSPTAMHA